MDLTAEQLKANWDNLLAKINNNFSGERKDLLISQVADLTFDTILGKITGA